MKDILKLDVAFTDESPEEVIAILKEAGVQNVKKLEGRGFTGIEIIVAGILVANALANLVIRLLPLWKCGVIVDTRGPRVLVKKVRDLCHAGMLW